MDKNVGEYYISQLGIFPKSPQIIIYKSKKSPPVLGGLKYKVFEFISRQDCNGKN